MDYRSTLIRSVEIPSTLPPMDTLTDLAGSLILKEVSTEGDLIRIEGDLLWRGYFEESGGECLWEGAEYFSETIHCEPLRNANTAMIEPTILSLKGESLSDTTYRLTFDIRWFEDSSREESAEVIEEETKRAEDEQRSKVEPEAEKCNLHQDCTCKAEAQEKKAKLEEKLKRIDETWHETVKSFNDINKEETKAKEKNKEETKNTKTEEGQKETKTCPYSKYCLRYYRTQDGDELERIAERFSATVAKLKEFNRLDNAELPAGRVLRIP